MTQLAPDNRPKRPEDQFRFEFEFDALEKSKIDGREGRFIGGYVSTDHLDRQGERLIQEGLDFSHFLSKGWFNDNHSADADSLIGYPTSARLDTLPDGHKGWYVEGELLPAGANARADSIWNIAQGLAKAGGKRKLGYSVEGSILDRDPRNPKTVRKAQVREVAITRCPVNTKTSLNLLAKSLAVSTPAGEPGSADALQMESLEGVSDKKKKCLKGKCRDMKMKKGVAVELMLALEPKMSRALAERVFDYAARHHAVQED